MESFERLKDYSRESITFTSRSVIAFVFVVLLMLVLIARIYYLQVIEHDRYAAISENNRVQLQPVAPRRGLIFDRNGELLADNRPNFSVTLLKEEIRDLDATLVELGQLIELNDRDVERFRKRLDQRRRPFESVPLRFGLTEEEIARISLNYHRLPGVQVEADLIRYYPHGASLVHALGYVGRINERELSKVDEQNYAATHYIGKLGIEKFYEDILHGQVGFQKVETNARGRVLRVLERQDPVPGRDLQLSLDLRLQQFTESLLEGRRASVVAIDPSSGEILAMVSTPTYDPNLFVTGISSKDYNALRNSRDLPLFNRSLRGSYPPASTVKPIIALAALETNTFTAEDRVWDPGFYQITKNGRRYRDWKRWGHGWVDLNHALAQSCDVWFYEAGHKMGVDPMSDMLGRFGVGQDASLDQPEALTNFLPSREWKEGRRRLPWYPGDSINMSIGQGFLVMTPLQMATATAVMANRGRWVQPRMLQGVLDETGGEPQPYAPMLTRKEKPDDVVLKDPKHWDQVIEGMISVMHGSEGTARRSAEGAQYRIAGKTGTAQVVGIAQDEEYDAEALEERHRDHALFVAFAPVDNPKIALAVVVENGGGGSSTAAPVAREVMDAWLLGDYRNDLKEDG
ncbi:penicillin-binding protein 2 [Marinobacterium sediminicola]|uniref:Peptidoglycan D,D-transpeptidase MrdA n=1 Tax=Marinobacterium sediminicola TaxID=518898 RepID=A0ABY1S0D4_9GAMM|nr:penicillin-binding protein 2 [Marinobacterium sediminicola]ULG69625.1 penicillin-binding protein 2 [Marinobacterium sediminicola]SMR74647.1 penicillin-binding protein 2 [Marinobacterium sediminicola]